MLKHFIWLEWLGFLRASNFKANLAVKIILGVIALFYAAAFAMMGPVTYMGLKEEGLPVIPTMSTYLLYYFAADLFVRYFMQKSPVLNIRPLLAQGIRRKHIVNFALGKTFVSFFTWIGGVYWLPFMIAALVVDDNKLGVLAWTVMIWMIVYMLNLFNQLLNDATKWIVGVGLVIVALFVLDMQGYFALSAYTGPIFESVYHRPWLVLVPIAAFIGLLLYTHQFYVQRLYLDTGLSEVKQEAKSINWGFLESKGIIGTLIKNDLYLLLRNKRSKMTAIFTILFLFYGFLFFTEFGKETYGSNNVMHIFAGIFVTGGFIFMFGQFVPSWDSSYYPLLMTQKFPYRTYLEAKWWLMVVVTVFTTVLSVFYWAVYGWEVYRIILAAAVFNIGMNTHLVMLSGAFIKTPIDLSKTQGAFGDKQSFNITTFLLTIPKMVLPALLYGIGLWTNQPALGLWLVAGAGVIGFFARQAIFDLILRLYRKRKYETLAAYKFKG